MSYNFTAESVSEGQSGKLADQIADALVDAYLKRDPRAHVNITTLLSAGMVVLSGHVISTARFDYRHIVRETIKNAGYNNSEYGFDGNTCAIISTLYEELPDNTQEDSHRQVSLPVDQTTVTGYATKETETYLPLPLDIAHRIVQILNEVRKKNRRMKYLRPDAKAQVTVEYTDRHRPRKISAISVSQQHDEFINPGNEKQASRDTAATKMQTKIAQDIWRTVLPKVRRSLPRRLKKFLRSQYQLIVNPHGNFVEGGPFSDTGVSGSLNDSDTFGGKASPGDSAISGKDSSFAARSGAYEARHIAKNLVAAGVADEIFIQLSYNAGMNAPFNVLADTNNSIKIKNMQGKKMKDEELTEHIKHIFDLRIESIRKRLGLNYPVFYPASIYGHYGKIPYQKETELNYEGETFSKEISFFSWEKLDYLEYIRKQFGID